MQVQLPPADVTNAASVVPPISEVVAGRCVVVVLLEIGGGVDVLAGVEDGMAVVSPAGLATTLDGRATGVVVVPFADEAKVEGTG